MTTSPPGLMNLTEAGKALGKTRETVRRWVDAGILESTTEGKRRYIRKTEIDKVIANRTPEA